MKFANSTSIMRRRRRRFARSYPRINRYMSLAGRTFKLQRQVNFIKGMVNAEKHYVDVDLSVNPSNTGSVQLINTIAQGDDVNNRQGNSVLCKYLRFIMNGAMNGSATNTIIRIIIFCDTANQGVTPSVTDYLTGANTTSFKNVDNHKRFVTLRDKTYHMSINGVREIADYIYCKTNFHLRYSGAGSTSVLQNALYLLIISNEATNTPVVTIQSRTAFYDN